MKRRLVVGAVALGVGAVLAVCGTMLELFRAEFSFEPGRVDRQVFTAFQTTFDFASMAEPETVSGIGWGYGIVSAAVLAVLALVLLFRSPLLGAVGRFVAVLAAGLLIGTAGSTYQTLDRLFGAPAESQGVTIVGPGLWVLLFSCLLLVAGAALVQEWPAREPAPAGPAVYRVDGEDDTPPFGIPIATDEIPADEVETRGRGDSPERG